ncbi:uncharacterized protein JCM6883_004630 [Sporobolomyces salmoneus]|uniref:uncharacterized protein n=1 Tax=Sporobolomyces salmoneus TaxID=183962 RepID=UPI003176C0F2
MSGVNPERFEQYLYDIGEFTMDWAKSHSDHLFTIADYSDVSLLLSRWKKSMREKFHPNKPLLRSPHENLKLWRVIEWNFLRRMDVAVVWWSKQESKWLLRNTWSPHDLLILSEEGLKQPYNPDKEKLSSIAWIRSKPNLDVPIRELFSNQQGFEKALDLAAVVLRFFHDPSPAPGEKDKWVDEMTTLFKDLRIQAPILARRFVFILQKFANQLDVTPEGAVDENGKIREAWTKAGIIRRLQTPEDPIFHNFELVPRSKPSHSLQKRINSRHAARMGVPVSKEEAKDGGRYF